MTEDEVKGMVVEVAKHACKAMYDNSINDPRMEGVDMDDFFLNVALRVLQAVFKTNLEQVIAPEDHAEYTMWMLGAVAELLNETSGTIEIQKVDGDGQPIFKH